MVGQGKRSSLPPSLHTGRGDFFSLATWFCPQNAQRAAHPRLLPPPAWGNWDSGQKAVPVTVSQGSVLLIQNKFWISSAGGCSPPSLGAAFIPRAVRGCISLRPDCLRTAAPLFVSLPLFLPLQLL